MAPTDIAQILSILSEIRGDVARLIARDELRDERCARHSQGIRALAAADDRARDAHVSQLEDELAAQAGLQARKPSTDNVSVARWQAIAILGAAALTGGMLASLARVVVTALAHAMGIGG